MQRDSTIYWKNIQNKNQIINKRSRYPKIYRLSTVNKPEHQSINYKTQRRPWQTKNWRSRIPQKEQNILSSSGGRSLHYSTPKLSPPDKQKTAYIINLTNHHSKSTYNTTKKHRQGGYGTFTVTYHISWHIKNNILEKATLKSVDAIHIRYII